MAYPGRYGTVPRGGNSADTTLTSSYRPTTTNTTANYLQTTSAPRAVHNGPQPGNVATNSALATSSSHVTTTAGALYVPQPGKPVSLKSGFTMSISDPELLATRTTLPQTLVTPEYLNEESLFNDLLTELLASSSRNEADSVAKKELLARAQQISVDIWKIGSNRSTITATCRDDNIVTEQVTSQYAEFNTQLADAFQQILRKICDTNITTAADSYVSLTAYEVALSRLAHHYYISRNITALKLAFARLTRAVGSAASQIVPQTLDVLRGLIYFIGLALLRMDHRSEAQVDLLSSPSQSSSDLTSDPLVAAAASMRLDGKADTLSMFFLRHLLEAQGLQWACALLHPSLEDLFTLDWLATAYDSRYLNHMTELEMVKVVTQIPWAEFAQLSGSANLVDEPEYSTIILPEFSSEPEEGRKVKKTTSSSITPSHPQFLEIIKRTILLPIQAAVAVAASKNYVGAIVFLSKILSLVSRSLPSQLTSTCVGILMRAPWPAKMVSIPSLQLFDWNALNRETLLLLFGELYHLFQRKPADYFATSLREVKLEHRSQFANYVVSNQPMMTVTYQIDSTLYRLNFQRFYPIFFILAQIALAWMKLSASDASSTSLLDGNRDLLDLPNLGESSDLASFDLPRLAVEELFHFAACWTPNPASPNYAFQCSALAQFRAESHDALHRICQESPRLYEHVMLELLYGLQMPNFPIASGLAQLQPQLMTIDWKLFTSLHFLFTRRPLSALPPPNSPTYRSVVSMIAEEIMGDGNGAQERVTDVSAWTVATDVFSRLLWHKAPPMLSAFAILLLLALRRVRGAPATASDWIHSMLARLFAPSVLANFSPLATDLLLEQLAQCPLDYAAALSTRTIVALNAVKNAVKHQGHSGGAFSASSTSITSTNILRTGTGLGTGFGGSSTSSTQSDGSASRYTFSWLWDSFKLKSVMDHLIMALRKLPNPQMQQQQQQRGGNPTSTNRLATSATATNTAASGSRGYPSLFLLKRVVYYYAHCIKHSPGQGQREISVVFNQLVDQLELFQKGSGMTAIEELFNESMGPRAGAQMSNEASQMESRALFLDFWVFALVPRLPEWSTSDALARTLDAFAYSAFFSQARFGEMVSLLPQRQVTLTAGAKPQTVSAVHQFSFVELSNLLQKKLIWLVYFIIWAYNPPFDAYQLAGDEAQPTPSARFRSSQLWRWVEAATSPHMPPSTALIFWERFFWGYFEVAAQRASTEFIPSRWQNMIHSFLLRSGYSLAHPGEDPALKSIIRPDDLIPLPSDDVTGTPPPILAMNHVYARLTTWNKGEIFTSGAYLFQPLLLPHDAPEASLLAELHSLSQVPSLFAIAYDPAKEDLTAQKPFPPLPLPETPDVVASLIPPPRSDNSALFTNETNLNIAYLFELDRNRKALEKLVLDEASAAALPPQPQSSSSTLTPGNPDGHTDFNPRLGVSGNHSLTKRNGSTRIPALEDLDVWSSQLTSLESDLRACDDRELSALKTLWRVVEKHVPLVMSCGAGCAGPHRVTVKSMAVLPGEGQSDAIQRARSEYEQVRMSQLSAQRSLASSVVIIEDLARCTLDVTGIEETHKNSLLVNLFFQLLPKLLDDSIRDSSPIYTRLMSSALLLGREAIQNRPTRDHMMFFKTLLELRRHDAVSRQASSPLSTLEPSNGGGAAASALIPLIELFTPSCFIQADDYSVYVELLYILVHTPIVSGEGLTIEEQVALASQFTLAKFIDRLVESHLQRLFDILDLAAVKPALIELVNLGITAILKRYAGQLSKLKMGSDFNGFGELATSTPSSELVDTGSSFPSADRNVSETKQTAEIVGRIVRLVLLACPHSPMLGSWEMMNDAWLGPYLLPFVSSALPSPSAAVVGSAISLVSRVAQLPNFDVTAHFDLLATFFKALFSNAPEKPLLSSKNRAAFTAGYELLVSRLRADQVWQLYLNVITPFFAHNSGADLSQPLDILCSAKWGQISLHLTDPTFVIQLSQLPLFHMPLVRTIFSSISWLEYANVAKENAQKPVAQESLVAVSGEIPVVSRSTITEPKMIHFLSLFFKMNLLAPSYIDANLKKLVMSVSKQPNVWYNEGRHLFDWREAKPEDFPLAFRGDTLVRTLRAISVSPRSSDPSTDFLENIQLFNDVSRYSGCVEAIEVCLEEIRAALFFATPSCAPSAPAGSLWHLPIHANVECVSNHMIPLTQQYHQMQAERCTLPMAENGAPRMIYHQSSYDALVSLLAVAGFAFANFDAENSSQFGNSAENSPQSGRSLSALAQPNITPVYRMLDFPVPFYVSPGTTQGLDNFRKETMKAAEVIKGLIVRFMGTLDNDLCLAVLHVASRAFPSDHQHAALVVLWEESLRSFFTQSKFAEQLTIAVNAITIPDEQRKLQVLRKCGEMRCPLAMRLILETERQAWLNFPRGQKYSEAAASTIPFIIECRAPLHREFDLFVLWFFVLDVVSHPKFQLGIGNSPSSSSSSSPHTATSTNSIGSANITSNISALIEYFNRHTGENEGLIINYFNKINSFFDDNSVNKDMMKLGMRAVRLILQRELTAKEPLAHSIIPESVLPKDLDGQLQQIAKLYPGKKGSEMQRYPSFFTELLPSILSPRLEIPIFEMKLVRFLVPIAPYLQCFIDGHENWDDSGV